jgi:hypothetical protein
MLGDRERACDPHASSRHNLPHPRVPGMDRWAHRHGAGAQLVLPTDSSNGCEGRVWTGGNLLQSQPRAFLQRPSASRLGQRQVHFPALPIKRWYPLGTRPRVLGQSHHARSQTGRDGGKKELSQLERSKGPGKRRGRSGWQPRPLPRSP